MHGRAQSLSIEQGRFQIDKSAKIIVCNQLPVSLGESPVKLLFDQQEFAVSGVVTNFEIGKKYSVTKDGTTYALFFTNFPIIRINTNNVKISENDDLTRGSVSINPASGAAFTSFMGIKVRGATSRTYPKKSYKIELSQDEAGNDSRDASLLGLREDSEWLLMAMYNEPMRLTNVTSHALWLKMHKLYYASKEPEANSAIRTRYCDVFANDTYLGVYAFAEDMDRKQLKLKKTGDNGEIRGELYKADGWSNATTYASPLPPYNANAQEGWYGYEQKLPKDPYHWANLYDYLKFVVNSSPEVFNANIKTWLRIDNVVDYFLFLNLIRATDNTGKNVILARYKEGEPYFFIPWDLDGSFGYLFSSGKANVTNDILTNGLFNRLMNRNSDGFNFKLRKRWFELRKNELSTANLKKDLSDNNALLKTEGAYDRERIKWGSSVDSEALAYMHTWVEQRTAYLDQYFATIAEEGAVVNNHEGFLSTVNCSSISGWAWNNTAPNTPVTVEFFEGYSIVGETSAGVFRQDLKNSGKGNGAHGFDFAMPGFLKDGKPHYISARVKGTGFVLKDSYKTFNCPGNGTGAPTNQPPQAPAVSPLSATVGAAFTTTLPGFTDSDPLAYTLFGLPNGLTFTAGERKITGSPTVSGTFSLTYTATDGQAVTPAFVSLVVSNPVSEPPTNQPPQAPAVSPLSATVGAAFSATLPGFTDSDPLAYTLLGLPDGLTFNAAARTITGSPTVSNAFSLTYTALDSKGASSFVLITLTVSPASPVPPVTVTGNFDGYLDKVECGSIRGWVWDRDKPNLALTVEFFANNVSIGTAKADIFRQDLKDTGKGNGAHVYSFPTPASVKTGTNHQISAKVQNSNYVLKWSPKSLNCPVGSRLSGEEMAVEAVEGLAVWPNPSDGRFEIRYRLEGGKPGELLVIDAAGRGWFRKVVEGEGVHRQNVSLSGAQGTFVIQLRQGDTVKSRKIILGR
ncbi:CotH kinase family protein [Larkinella ripae]